MTMLIAQDLKYQGCDLYVVRSNDPEWPVTLCVRYIGTDNSGSLCVRNNSTGATKSFPEGWLSQTLTQAAVNKVNEFVKEPEPVPLHGTGSSDPLSYQVGGSHYNSMAIQPITFITKNNIPYREANVIKYVCRHANKNGLEDLLKARQYLDMLIAAEYPDHKLDD